MILNLCRSIIVTTYRWNGVNSKIQIIKNIYKYKRHIKILKCKTTLNPWINKLPLSTWFWLYNAKKYVKLFVEIIYKGKTILKDTLSEVMSFIFDNEYL